MYCTNDDKSLLEFHNSDLREFQHKDVLLVFLKRPGLDPDVVLNSVDHHRVAAEGVTQEGHVLFLIEGDHTDQYR